MPLERIVIVGNDDIAWIAADMLSHRAVPRVAIELVRPDEAPGAWATLAHGATLTPAAAEIGDAVGRDELALLRVGRGTFLTGSVLRGFGPATGFVPFGEIGEPAGQIGFHHLVARRRATDPALPLTAFMGGALCAQASRFAPPGAADAFGQAAFNYGFHVESRGLAAAAAGAAMARGVEVSVGSIAGVARDDGGNITSLTTDHGAVVTGDLFVDSGNWLQDDDAFVDWSRWLPCDRIASAIRASAATPAVAMQLAAHSGGWQRQGSLNGALIDGFAYCDGAPGERPAGALAFRSGRCEKPWRGNRVVIGDGAVILDPIADMRLPFAMAGLARLAGLLPAGADQSVEAREYNRQTIAELDHARDFAAAHYVLNGRGGDPFWDQCRAIAPPDSLAARVDLYQACGRIAEADHAPHAAAAWIALFDALGLRPKRHDTLADMMPVEALDRHLRLVRDRLLAAVAAMPPYEETVRRLAGRTTETKRNHQPPIDSDSLT